MNLDSEMRYLVDLMPASGRMLTKIVSKPQQSKVIDVSLPMPWHRGNRPIYLNFDLWKRLSRGQRDLLLLRTVSWLTGIKWLAPDLYQGATLVGLLALTVELIQGDGVGIVVAGGFSAMALQEIWRSASSTKTELEADEAAIQIAGRRGYSESEAAKYLFEGIKNVTKVEGRSSLSFKELIRSQNLKAIANLSPVGVPESIRK